MRGIAIVAACGCVVTMLSTVHVLGDGARPVIDLLVDRSARLEAVDGAAVLYHHRDGRVVRQDDTGGAARHGRWWIDENGAYCFRLEAEGVDHCFIAGTTGEVLQLQSIHDASRLAIHVLAPEDVRQWPEGEAKDAAGCDCRPARRRGAQGG
jgi:hypothetical protein